MSLFSNLFGGKKPQAPSDWSTWSPDRIRAYVQAGGDPNGRDADGATPLIQAVALGHLPTTDELLRRGADPNVRTDNGLAVLHYAVMARCSAANKTAIISALIDAGADVNARDPDGLTPLMCATLKGEREIEHFFAGRGADPEMRDNRGGTAARWADIGHTWRQDSTLAGSFDWAAMSESEIRTFLAEGGDVNRLDKDGATALMAATAMGADALVRDLLARNADVNAADHDGQTALMLAAGLETPATSRIIEALLASKADVNLQKRDGWSALMFAAARNRPDVVRTLLDHGADAGRRNAHGMTAHTLAKANGHARILALLR